MIASVIVPPLILALAFGLGIAAAVIVNVLMNRRPR